MGFSDRGARVSPHRMTNGHNHQDIAHHDALHAGRVAVITGAASGIGLAAAQELARIGMKLAIADVNETSLADLKKELSKTVGEQNLMAVVCDVSNIEDVRRFRERVFDTWGEVSVLLNNAGISGKTGSWSDLETWGKIMNANMWGIVNVQHCFVPYMIGQENQSLIINTGSKQGITNPPGNPAYNASKAAIKSLTESLAYELRQQPTKLTAHLFVPGWTHTGLSSSPIKPDRAWTPDQTVQYMLNRVRAGQFYIICPDNEVSSDVDSLRIMWAAGDVAQGRPALSRWHPDFKGEFEEYMRDGLAEAQMQ